MREIKFRIYFKDEEPFMSEPIALEDLLFEDWIEFENEEVSLPLKDFRFYYNKKGDSYKIMQYTGLKDKNGKEIYEGDIVSKETFDDTKPNYRNISYAKVVWIKELAGFYLVNRENKILWELSEDKYNIEVAGNIYENSNLLEKENK